MTEQRPQPTTRRAEKGKDYTISDIPGGWRITGAAGDARAWAKALIGVREKRQAEPARRRAKRRMMAAVLARKEAALRKSKARLRND